MWRVVLLLALTGCSQIFGLQSPQQGGDAMQSDTGSAGPSDAYQYDTSPGSDAYVTVSFQQGVASYAGALDTYLDSGAPSSPRNTDIQVRWRTSSRWGLLQFQSIFGGTAVSPTIPPGSQIVSARLDLYMTNNNCGVGHIADVAVSWADNTTYDTFGPIAGVDTSDLGAAGATTPTSNGLQGVNVTSSVSSWSTDATKNDGWIFIADGSGGGDCSFRSSNDGSPTNRPRLVVTYAP